MIEVLFSGFQAIGDRDFNYFGSFLKFRKFFEIISVCIKAPIEKAALLHAGLRIELLTVFEKFEF